MVDQVNALFLRAFLRAKDGLRREEGQAVTEYALIVGLVVVAAVALLATLGTQVKDFLTSLTNGISGATTTTGG